MRPDHFVSQRAGTEPATAEVWAWVLSHRHRYKADPSLDLFRRRWPGFVMLEVTDTVEAVLDEFIRVVKRRKAIDKIRDLSEIVDDWSRVGDIEVHFQEASKDLARLVPTTSVIRFSDSLDRREDYLRKLAQGDSLGVSTMIPEFDDITHGVGDFEMMVIEGMLNAGKSSWGVGMAGRAYFERDETPLFMTLEMDGQKLATRWDSYAAKMEYRALKRLELGEGDLERWYKIGEKAANAKFEKDILVIDDLYRPSVERIYTEVEKWDPRFVIVDPIDEINAPSMYRSLYERQGYAARELKGMARTLRKPFIVMAQAGREAEQEGATIGNIAGSIDIARKADIVVGMHATADMVKMKKMRLQLLKIRDDEGKGFTVTYKWDVGKMDFRPWRPDDAVVVKQEEAVA